MYVFSRSEVLFFVVKMLTESRDVFKQHHVALQREVVHVMHKTHAYRYGMHVVSQLVVDLSVRKGLL